MAISFTGKSRILAKFYDLIYRLLKILYRKPKICGYKKLRPRSPRVFIANHQDSYGPIILMTHLPFTVYPWVTHEIVDGRLCPAYVEKDFLYKEIRLKSPLSILLSTVIGKICVSLMRYLEAIPVYKHDRKGVESLRLSAKYLEAGRDLLLFPEISNTWRNEKICAFDNGFVRIARLYAERNEKKVLFYPVAVDKGRRRVTIGEPISLSDGCGFHADKRRIALDLETRIYEMLDHEQLQTPTRELHQGTSSM